MQAWKSLPATTTNLTWSMTSKIILRRTRTQKSLLPLKDSRLIFQNTPPSRSLISLLNKALEILPKWSNNIIIIHQVKEKLYLREQFQTNPTTQLENSTTLDKTESTTTIFCLQTSNLIASLPWIEESPVCLSCFPTKNWRPHFSPSCLTPSCSY